MCPRRVPARSTSRTIASLPFSAHDVLLVDAASMTSACSPAAAALPSDTSALVTPSVQFAGTGAGASSPARPGSSGFVVISFSAGGGLPSGCAGEHPATPGGGGAGGGLAGGETNPAPPHGPENKAPPGTR